MSYPKFFSFIILASFFLGCNALEKQLEKVKAINLVTNAPESVNYITAPTSDLNRKSTEISISFPSVKIDKTLSSIIIVTDTIAFASIPGEVNVETGGSRQNLILDLGIGQNQYYCQQFKDNKLIQESGIVGAPGHFNPAGLTPVADVLASDYAVTPNSKTQVCLILKNGAIGAPSQCFSTQDKRICIYESGGRYYVVELSPI